METIVPELVKYLHVSVKCSNQNPSRTTISTKQTQSENISKYKHNQIKINNIPGFAQRRRARAMNFSGQLRK